VIPTYHSCQPTRSPRQGSGGVDQGLPEGQLLVVWWLRPRLACGFWLVRAPSSRAAPRANLDGVAVRCGNGRFHHPSLAECTALRRHALQTLADVVHYARNVGAFQSNAPTVSATRCCERPWWRSQYTAKMRMCRNTVATRLKAVRLGSSIRMRPDSVNRYYRRTTSRRQDAAEPPIPMALITLNQCRLRIVQATHNCVSLSGRAADSLSGLINNAGF
jgi:hypothetical protein